MREDLQHPDITEMEKKGHLGRRPKYNNQEYVDYTTRKDVEQMMLDEILDTGAGIDIDYHGLESKEAARKKLEPFKSLGEITFGAGIDGKTTWLEIADRYIHITAFYEEEK